MPPLFYIDMNVGIDITRASRFERLLSQYGDRFYRRFLTSHELSKPITANYLAKCWAVKEACVKATGIRDLKAFTYAKNGPRPYVETTLPFQFVLTVSDEDDIVIAMVVVYG